MAGKAKARHIGHGARNRRQQAGSCTERALHAGEGRFDIRAAREAAHMGREQHACAEGLGEDQGVARLRA